MTTAVSVPGDRRLLMALIALVASVAISALAAPPIARAGIPICDVSASDTSVLVGDQVTFTGTGFAANTAISVFAQLDAGPVTLAASGTTNGAGTFIFTAPLPAVGVVTVQFTQTGCSDSVAVTVTCVADVTATATNVLAGDQVTFTGTGFAPSTAIAIFGQLDSGPLTPAANGTTDGAGSFVFTTNLTVVGVVTVLFEQVNGCSDSTAVTVGAAATAAPSPSGLPDAAMSPPSTSGPAVAVMLLAWMLVILAAATARSRA